MSNISNIDNTSNISNTPKGDINRLKVVMLYAVLCKLRSLREVEIGFEANATRMNHLGLDHMICRSTLADANKRRKSSFFGSIYAMLYQQYAPLLSNSNNKKCNLTIA